MSKNVTAGSCYATPSLYLCYAVIDESQPTPKIHSKMFQCLFVHPQGFSVEAIHFGYLQQQQPQSQSQTHLPSLIMRPDVLLPQTTTPNITTLPASKRTLQLLTLTPQAQSTAGQSTSSVSLPYSTSTHLLTQSSLLPSLSKTQAD